MMKIVTVILLSLGSLVMCLSQTTTVQKLEKSNKKESSPIPIAVQYAKMGSQPFCERAFVKEYILSHEAPSDLPKMIDYTDSIEFKLALKNWIIANPGLIKPAKRIKIKQE
ncbi:hypothetical protein N9M27_04110 [Flavobacteriales bacterium]|nr:hypothetical protein [Flavobacteriales bacterium]